MSLIHLEKSVLTFHLKEILEDGHVSHPLTWLSLGLLIFGPKLLPGGVQPQPTTKILNAKRSGYAQVSLSQWIAEAKQRELQSQVYAAIRAQTALAAKQEHLNPEIALMN
jgi:hypothetical protein